MVRKDPSGQRDGAVLRTLAGGLDVVRYRKHDPIDPAKVPRARLTALTGFRTGSKFLPSWGLARYIDWVDRQVAVAGWTTGQTSPRKVVLRVGEPVGVVSGKIVRSVCMVTDGRHVHAYPVSD